MSMAKAAWGPSPKPRAGASGRDGEARQSHPAAGTAGPAGRKAPRVAAAMVVAVAGEAAAMASRIAPTIRPRTRPESRKRTSVLAGMDVDVDLVRVEVEEQHDGRMAVARHGVGIGAADGAEQQAVADRPAVDEEVLARRRRLAEGRQAGEAEEADASPRHRRSAGRSRAKSRPTTSAMRASGPPRRRPGRGAASPPSARRARRRRRMGQRQPRTTSATAAASARSLFRNFSRAGVAAKRSRPPPACRRQSRRAAFALAAGIDGQRPGRGARRRGAWSSSGARPRRWRAAPRPGSRGCGCREVVVGELGGGVALDAEGEVGAVHAGAVVETRISRRPPASISHVDARGAGVERVLDELLDRAAGRSITSPAAMRLTTPSGSWRTAMA
jgi:hypothetical protein